MRARGVHVPGQALLCAVQRPARHITERCAISRAEHDRTHGKCTHHMHSVACVHGHICAMWQPHHESIMQMNAYTAWCCTTPNNQAFNRLGPPPACAVALVYSDRLPTAPDWLSEALLFLPPKKLLFLDAVFFWGGAFAPGGARPRGSGGGRGAGGR